MRCYLWCDVGDDDDDDGVDADGGVDAGDADAIVDVDLVDGDDGVVD